MSGQSEKRRGSRSASVLELGASLVHHDQWNLGSDSLPLSRSLNRTTYSSVSGHALPDHSAESLAARWFVRMHAADFFSALKITTLACRPRLQEQLPLVLSGCGKVYYPDHHLHHQFLV
jgi:hypothetical protein